MNANQREQSRTCKHEWTGYSGGRCCVTCGLCVRDVDEAHTDHFWRTMFVAGVGYVMIFAVALALLTGCATRPHSQQDQPQTQPGSDQSRDWSADATARRGDDRIREIIDGEEVRASEPAAGSPAPPVGHGGDDPPQGGRPQLPAWRVEIAAMQAHGLDGLVAAGHEPPPRLIAVYYLIRRGLPVSRVWELQREAGPEIEELPERLRQPFREVLIELGKRRAEAQ